MSFQIKGLPAERFAPLFKLTDTELTACAAVRLTADRYPGFPCRVSLCEAQAGETVMLLNYEHPVRRKSIPVAPRNLCA
jgi:Protein of unknown function (DUF1203)